MVCLLLQALVGLGPPCHIAIDIADKDQRKKQTVMKEGVQEVYYVFTGNDTVAGEVGALRLRIDSACMGV
jgi:hypothetical protein